MASSGNFGTIGGLEKQTNFTFSQNNLKYSTTTNNRGFICSAGFPDTGKWYYEMYIIGTGGTQDQVFIGVCTPDTMRANLTQSRGGATGSYGGYVFDNYDGKAYLNGTGQSADSIGNFRSFPQKVGILVNRDDNEIKWTLNGSDLSSAYTIPTGLLYPYIGSGGGTNTASGVFNFGQDSTFGGAVSAGGNSDSNGFGDFTFSVPSNYVALTSPNIPISDDIDPGGDDGETENSTKQFGVVLYTGNGSSNAISGLGFQPDLVWAKMRSSSQSHILIDSSRGQGLLFANLQNVEQTSNGPFMTSYDSDGFTLSSSGSNPNDNSQTYVAWCWKANGGTTTSFSASGNQLAGTYQANTKSKFSIITYTGSGSTGEVLHGLGTTPNFIIYKARNDTHWWGVYLKSDGTVHTGYNSLLYFNSANALASGQNVNIVPDSTKIAFAGNEQLNRSSYNYVMYAWADVDGMQKFGSYEGNGDADGPFVYTGFRPRFLIIKARDSGQTWFMYDTERSTYNPVNRYLYGQRDLAEDTAGSIDIDFLSNGFKIRNSRSDTNTSGDTYLYISFADVPFKYNNSF